MYRLASDDLQGGNSGINNRAFIDAEYNRAFVTNSTFSLPDSRRDCGKNPIRSVAIEFSMNR
jgi:hypothetical protein